ncbi:MAG TPA: hypothetical protein VL334_05895 [Anaerolineae bacterium]|nr:hypothetical protein [Anaerolineae bacterium]
MSLANMLPAITTLFDLVALAVSLGLALYIGEGTFNRTRRRALQGVARALHEMEEAERRTMNDGHCGGFWRFVALQWRR